MVVTHIPHNLPTAQKTVSVLDKVKKKLIKLTLRICLIKLRSGNKAIIQMIVNTNDLFHQIIHFC
jgi:hypothetical protein